MSESWTPMSVPTAPEGGDLAARARARRPKAQLSCVPCRTKKQRCDRGKPCRNCARIAPQRCVYVAQSPSEKRLMDLAGASGQVRGGMPNGRVFDRIQMLEQRVAMLADQAARLNEDGDEIATSARGSEDREMGTRGEDVPRELPPRLAVDDEDSATHFISPSHWEGILSDIAGIKQELGSYHSSRSGEMDSGTKQSTSIGPHLLFHGRESISMEELVCSLPAKNVVYDLIHQYASDTGIPPLLSVAMHLPTFLQDCQSFYNDPYSVSLNWLCMLFAVLSLALQTLLRAEATIDGIMLPEASCKLYTIQAAQCLAQNDYAKPTKGTVEALIFYLSCEHYWMERDHFRASIVYSIIVRVAHRMGYHRDPRHYPHMSVFQAEMQRRTWALIKQMDLFLASKCGLPRLIGTRQTDTTPPLNLRDEDLSPTMLDPPVSRSDAEWSVIGYLNYKTRLLITLGAIVDRTSGSQVLTYDDVMQLEASVVNNIDTRPAWLQPPALNVPLRCPAELTGWLIDADLVVQRQRMLLHRKFMVPARKNPRFSFSKATCLQAAKQTLCYQRQLHDASNWRLLALLMHDFILGAMILSLDVDQDLQLLQLSEISFIERKDCTERVASHIDTLKSVYRVWTACLERSASAQEAHGILKGMLERFELAQASSPPYTTPSSLQADTPQFAPLQPMYPGAEMSTGPGMGQWVTSGELGVNSVAGMDWTAWDNFYGSNMGMYN